MKRCRCDAADGYQAIDGDGNLASVVLHKGVEAALINTSEAVVIAVYP